MAEKKKKVSIYIMLKTESEILEKLDSVSNKSVYIKELIRKDMVREKGESNG